MTQLIHSTDYSRENAEKFGWAGFSAAVNLLPERVELLDRNIIGNKILDAGCGSGAFVDYFANRGLDAVGVDKHEFCLAAAKDRRYKGTFVQADLANSLPFADNSFDTAICCDVLEHIDDYRALSELRRVTRSRIIFTVPQDASRIKHTRLIYTPYQDHTHLRYYTEDMIVKLASSVSSSYTIAGEQPIDIRSLMTTFFLPESKYSTLTQIYKRVSIFLMKRVPNRNLYINWSVVIDLKDDQ